MQAMIPSFFASHVLARVGLSAHLRVLALLQLKEAALHERKCRLLCAVSPAAGHPLPHSLAAPYAILCTAAGDAGCTACSLPGTAPALPRSKLHQPVGR